MQLCPAAHLANHDDVDELAQWAQNAFDYLVGNASFVHVLSESALLLLLLLLLTVCTAAAPCIEPTALLRRVPTAQDHVPNHKTVGELPQCIYITSARHSSRHTVSKLHVGAVSDVHCSLDCQALLFAIGYGRFPVPLRLHAEWAWGAACLSHAHSMPAP